MKIAVIGAKGLPAKQGGIEHYCQELYERVVAEGHEVDLFARSSYTQTPWFACENIKGVKVITLPSIPLKGVDALTNSAMGAIASCLGSYDVVHFHALGPSLFSWLPKIKGATTVVVTCHGLDWQRSKWGALSSQLIYWGEKIAVSYADEIVVVSEELQKYFQTTYGISAAYIPTAPATYAASNAQSSYLQTQRLIPQNYILFLGRLVPEKRPELLIKAYLSLPSPAWKLVIAGGACHTEKYTQKLVSLTEGNPNVVFTGELKGEKLAEVMRGAGLFVLPSDLEGLPLVMLEAMREGIPVLASDIPAHRQLIGPGEERGLLFSVGNLPSCVEKLVYALENAERIRAIAQNARDYIQTHYNWKNITYEKLKLYDKVITSTAMMKTSQRHSQARNPRTTPPLKAK